MAKQKVYSEKEMAMMDMLEARAELQRAEDMFGWVNDEYFEIANMELTIAKLKYEVAIKKLLMLFCDNVQNKTNRKQKHTYYHHEYRHNKRGESAITRNKVVG